MRAEGSEKRKEGDLRLRGGGRDAHTITTSLHTYDTVFYDTVLIYHHVFLTYICTRFLRLRMAQEIQRQLEECEVKTRELEERGVAVEKALRGEAVSGPSWQSYIFYLFLFVAKVTV